MSSFIWLPLTKKGGEKSSEELKAAFAKKGCKPSQTKPHWPSPGPRLAAAVKQKDWSVRGFPHWLPPAVCRHFRQLKQTQLPQFGIPSNSIYSFFHCLFIFLLLLIPSTPPFSPCVLFIWLFIYSAQFNQVADWVACSLACFPWSVGARVCVCRQKWLPLLWLHFDCC